MNAAPYQWLIVTLDDPPSVVLLHNGDGIPEIVGERYTDSGFGPFTTFYDWLRDDEHRVVGVRFWPYQEAAFLLDVVVDLPNATVVEDQEYAEVFFSAGREFRPEISTDQDFGENYVLSSPSGGYALAFDSSRVDAPEVERIESLASALRRAG